MYLLTVRGRKSGLPCIVPIEIWEHDGKRNLRAAGEAVLTRGRHSETVTVRALPQREVAPVLREDNITLFSLIVQPGKMNIP